MWKRYGNWLAIIVATWVAIVVVRGAVSLPRHRVVSITACYAALSDDLAPLLDPRVIDIAAASPECAPTGDVRDNVRDAIRILPTSGIKRRCAHGGKSFSRAMEPYFIGVPARPRRRRNADFRSRVCRIRYPYLRAM